MTCTCPKCAAQVQVDLHNVPEDGDSTPCPECQKRLWISRESFTKRTLKKEGSIYCLKCSNEITPLIVCTACGALYPDYCVVQTSKPAKRRLQKATVSWSFSRKPAVQTTYHAYHAYHAPKVSTSRPLKRLVTVVGLVTLAILLIVVIGIEYKNRKAERQYAANFALALCGIKVGTETSLNSCTKTAAEWKAKMIAEQNYSPRISAEDETRLTKTKDELDRIMQTLTKPPKKFDAANDKLSKLYGIYTKSQSLALVPTGTLAGFTDAANKTGNDYHQAAQELKTNMPKELSDVVQKAKTRYKGLQDF